MFIVFFSSVILGDSPLNAVQMLWVNLIMDTMAALALATEPPAHDILQRQPYSKDAPIMTDIMWRNVMGHGVYQIIALVVILFTAEGWFVYDYSSSCLKYSTTQKDSSGNYVCDEYNPFYTSELYLSQQSFSYWSDLKVTSANFATAALNEYTCTLYGQAPVASGSDTTPTCKAVKEHGRVLPSDSQIFKTKGVTNMSQKLLHYTMVFQMFVFMQLFNQINARKIEDGELNVFSGFFNNFLFLFVTILTFVVQMTMVEVGG